MKVRYDDEVNCKVYFNGDRQMTWIEADDERGYVDYFVKTDEWRLHRIFGEVRIELEKSGNMRSKVETGERDRW